MGREVLEEEGEEEGVLEDRISVRVEMRDHRNQAEWRTRGRAGEDVPSRHRDIAACVTRLWKANGPRIIKAILTRPRLELPNGSNDTPHPSRPRLLTS